jgi:hypothetical protein
MAITGMGVMFLFYFMRDKLLSLKLLPDELPKLILDEHEQGAWIQMTRAEDLRGKLHEDDWEKEKRIAAIAYHPPLKIIISADLFNKV